MNIIDHITPEPMPGHFYTIRYGDTLFGITSRAYGVSPGQERLAWARVINRARYNDRFRGQPKDMFPEGLVSFYPKFIADPAVQAEAEGYAPSGHSFATLWIPRHEGDEPAFHITDDDFVIATPVDDDDLPEPYADAGIPEDTDYWFTYRVQDGDTLHNIADALGVRWQFLAALNWSTEDPDRVSWCLANHFAVAQPVTPEWRFSRHDRPGLLLLPRQIPARLRRRGRRLYVSRFPANA